MYTVKDLVRVCKCWGLLYSLLNHFKSPTVFFLSFLLLLETYNLKTKKLSGKSCLHKFQLPFFFYQINNAVTQPLSVLYGSGLYLPIIISKSFKRFKDHLDKVNTEYKTVPASGKAVDYDIPKREEISEDSVTPTAIVTPTAVAPTTAAASHFDILSVGHKDIISLIEDENFG
ncbi:hypothetical protein B0H21DRAFT_709875 [Amylocystis lapponica]|nr:hypothetical protein B0H21DRAFT_709875 [Amylocystis lapponica]